LIDLSSFRGRNSIVATSGVDMASKTARKSSLVTLSRVVPSGRNF